MVSAMSELSDHRVEIDASGEVTALTFTANGEYLVSGGDGGIQVWRVKDGERVAIMPVKNGVLCVAASKNGVYIAGSSGGDVLVWDATNYAQVFTINIDSIPYDIDFSWDRLVFPYRHTATIWDVSARKKVQTLDHGDWVVAVKYSPRGDRIATASEEFVRVWDSSNGRLLVGCKGNADPHCGLHWLDDHLFVETNHSKIIRVDASSGSIISEWSVPGGTDKYSRIALPRHGKFVAYSLDDYISFQDTSTHTQLGSILRSGESRPIAFSPDDRLIAIVAQGRKIIFSDSPVITEPEICIESPVLDAWKDDQFTHAEALLTAALPSSKDTTHHILASRALVRTRLQQWDAALVDAQESIKIRSSAIGYIAKCAVLVGMGETRKGRRVYDLVFHLHSDLATVLVLVKAVILFMAGDHEDAISRIDDLITVMGVGVNSALYVVQAYMLLLLGNLHMQGGDYERAISTFERARTKLGGRTDQPPLIISLVSGWKFHDLALTIQQRSSEAFLSAGRTKEASESILCLMDQEVDMAEPIKTWVADIVQRCLFIPENYDSTARGNDVSCHMTRLARRWATLKLTTATWEDALIAATGVVVPRFTIYQVICERLEMTGRVAEAVSCLDQLCSKPAQGVDGENWIQDFKSRCCAKLEALGDSFMDTQDYDEAISQYTTALSLDPTFTTLRDLLGKRSKARAGKGEWENALNDANEMIKLDPFSPFGYENKHQALRGAGCFAAAMDVFETMLSKMLESSDPVVRGQSHRFVTPNQTKEAIREAIKSAIRDSPAVLISAISGRLCDKAEQATAFESMPIFTELVASMTTHIDYDLIRQEVEEFYRYATFSHTWEGKEPLFAKATEIVVYDLEVSPAYEKLQMFCKIVRETGFNWAWSDTRVDKADYVVLQEALISMFKWYEGSAMTIIFLHGVDRRAQRGAMTRSVWNSRAWTLQAYRASKVVRFYTEDWTPYLGLEIYNHKDSPEIISEMEQAMGISVRALMALRPGLDNIREKLRLASTQQTSWVEDAAYSLLGIFSLSPSVIYGEGDNALGRLLAQLLASSGDISILAWTGRSGPFNSCLPARITVFSQNPSSYIPPPIPDAGVRTVLTGLRSLDLALVAKLYDTLNGLSAPLFVGCRMKLPCLAFTLERVSFSRNGPEHVFRAQTDALGVVEIETEEDLSQLGSLYLIHPWIDFLLGRQSAGDMETKTEENLDRTLSAPGRLPSISFPSKIVSTTRTVHLMSRIGLLFSGRSTLGTGSLWPPSAVSPADKRTRVLQFIARLRQPFGALLLTRTHQDTAEYRRVAPESLITVQVEELTPATLDQVISGVQMLEVL